VEHVPSFLWPVLIAVGYVLVFLMLCEVYSWLDLFSPKGIFFGLPDGKYKYFWGGVDMLNAMTTFLQVKGRGSLLYLAMFARYPAESLGTATNVCGHLFMVVIISYNLVNITRDCYMYAVWTTIHFTSPLSFMESSLMVSASTALESLRAQESALAAVAPSYEHAEEASEQESSRPLQQDTLARDEATPLLSATSVLEASHQSTANEQPLVAEKKLDEVPAMEEVSATAQGQKGVECICCFDSAARYVTSNCGHLVACGQCRRRLVYLQLRKLGVAGIPTMRNLCAEMISQTEVSCPICRKSGVLVGLRLYTGNVFLP